jgi:hypothetical protein
MGGRHSSYGKLDEGVGFEILEVGLQTSSM